MQRFAYTVFFSFYNLTVNFYLTFGKIGQNYHLNTLKKALFQPLSEESNQLRLEALLKNQ